MRLILTGLDMPRDKRISALLVALSIYIVLAPTPWWPAVRNIAISVSLILSLVIFAENKGVYQHLFNKWITFTFIFCGLMSTSAVFYGTPLLISEDLSDIRVKYLEPLVVLFAGSILLYQGQERALFAVVLGSSLFLSIAWINKLLLLDANTPDWLSLRDMGFRFLVYFAYSLVGYRYACYKPLKILLLVNTIFQICAFFLMGFRGGVVAALCCTVFVLCFYGGWRILILFLGAVLASIIALKFISPPVYQYVHYKIHQKDSSDRWHGAYATTITMSKDKWLWGFGYGDQKFITVFKHYQSLNEAWRKYAPIGSPHNIFLQAWFHTGIIGLFAFCFMLSACVWFGGKLLRWLRQSQQDTLRLPMALTVGAMGTLVGDILVFGQFELPSLNNVGMCLLIISFYSKKYLTHFRSPFAKHECIVDANP